ncbi:MAG: superoxide dismutase [Desulfuromonadales bacterium]|nr:superoxide dismutase [Desulfuromonadales bacterium]
MLQLPELPYPKNALEPHLSARTLEFHHDKHHAAYVNKGNELLQGSGLENENIESIIKKSYGDSSKAALFNNVAQVWNHSFFWHCMKPGGGGKPTGAVADRINASFGSFDKFVEEFKAAGVGQFGSGWAWLVQNGDKLEVMKTPNAENPLHHNKKPLLTADVWEHAYYLDFQNRRPDFLSVFVEKLINWEFVAKNLG